MNKADKLAITKLDAAVRQLETAITLWFHGGDPVSIVTLCHAAHEIIYVLNKHRGGRPMMRDSEHIRPEYRDDWIKLRQAAPNFFKHAGKDPAAVHYFNPEATLFDLFEAATVYHSWNLEQRPLFSLLIQWMLIEHPNIFTEDYRNAVKDVIADTHYWLSQGKAAFYKDLLPLISRAAAGYPAKSPKR